MAILLCRVDDRLIHGQVVVGWGAQLGVDFIAVVDDELSASDWEQDLYRAGLPDTVSARFASTSDAIDLIPEWVNNAEQGFVLTRDIGTMRRLAESGVLDEIEVNLGGIHAAPGRERVMPYYGQERMEGAQDKGPLTDKEYIDALEKNRRLSRLEGIDAVMKEQELNAIVCPSGGPAWLIDLINGDGGRSWDMDSTSYAAVAGCPHITVPAGYVFGLPIGISFFAGAWQEPKLIKLAYAFEQATKVRVPPKFLLTADLSV